MEQAVHLPFQRHEPCDPALEQSATEQNSAIVPLNRATWQRASALQHRRRGLIRLSGCSKGCLFLL